MIPAPPSVVRTRPGQGPAPVRPGVILAQLLLCGVLAAAGFTYRAQPTEEIVYLLSCVLAGLFLWTIFTWRRVAGTIFDPYGLFLVLLFLFNGGHALLEVFGLNERGVLGGKFDIETTVASLYMVALGLSF